MDTQPSPVFVLKSRLNVVRETHRMCLTKVKKLLALLLQEDCLICACAVEEEELLAKINSVIERAYLSTKKT